jgi:hypothetical protein
LDDKELGFVKQLKRLQTEHSNLQMRHELLEESKKRVLEQFTTMRAGIDEAAEVISDLEGRIKELDQEKLGLELQQVKLEKEV